MRVPIKYCFLLLLSNLCNLQAFPQDFQVNSSPFTEIYGLGDQLSLNGIHCILLDRDGFFWIGNQRGLHRFDGTTTVSLEALVPGLSEPIVHVTAIHESDQNQIWIGAQGEIYSYDRGLIQVVHHPVDFTGVPFTTLPEIKGISLINATNLLVTTRKGLFRLIRKDGTANTWQVEHFQQLTITDEELKFFEDIASDNPLTAKLEITDSLRHTVSFQVEDSSTYLITATSPKMFSSIVEINDVAWLEDSSGDTVWNKYADFYFLPEQPSAVLLPPGQYTLHAQHKLFPYFEDLKSFYLITVRELDTSQANTFKKIVSNWNTRRNIVEDPTEHIFTDLQGTSWISGGGGLTSMKLVNDTPAFQVYTPHAGREFGQEAIHTYTFTSGVNRGFWLLGRGYSRPPDIQAGSDVFARNHIMHYRYDAQQFFRIPFEGSHPIADICEARDSSLWILQNDGTLVCLAVDPHLPYSLHYRHQFKLEGYKGFTRILCDLGNNIWIVTSQQGLIKIGHEENKINRWRLPLRTIRGVSNPTNPQPLLFTEAGKLYTYERVGQHLKGTLVTEVSEAALSCLLAIPPGYIAGTEMGDLFIIDPTSETSRIAGFNRVQSNPRYRIPVINLVPATDSTVYVSTHQGLFIFNHLDQTISENLIGPLDGVLPQVPDVLEYKGQKLAIANTYSMQYGNSGHMVPVTTDMPQDQTLKSHFSDMGIEINAAIVTQDDRLLVGSELGLHAYDPERDTFQVLASGQFPPVYNLLQDTDGDIWTIGSKGLSLFHLQTGDFLTFSQIFIPPKGFFDQKPPMWQGEDGYIYFSNGEELFSFSPHRLKNQWAVPRLHLDMVLSQDRSGTVQVIPVSTNSLVLQPFQKTFTIKFSTTNLSYPNQSTVNYRLAGYHEDWLPTDRMEVQYINVPPGHYSFEIRVRNGRHEDQQTVRLSILPFWWQTPLAKMGYLIVFLVVLWWIFRQIQQREKLKTHLQLEHLEKDKIAALHQLRSRFFANISHEFRTPLTLILGPLKEMYQGTFTGDRKAVLGVMIRNGQRLLNLINQLLDISKLEAGKMQLQATPTDLVALLRQIASSYESIATDKKIKYFFYPEMQELLVYADQEKIEKVVHNLLSNAFKFTPEGGDVILYLKTQEQQWALISVKDTGTGIPAEELDKVFDRFYQVDNSQTRAYEGSGLGLALAKELVEMHHGRLTVESKEGKGTTFTVWLPLGKAHLRPEEIRDAGEVETSKGVSIDQDILKDTKVAEMEDTAMNMAETNNPLILVVEDNADMRQYIRTTLGDQYQIREAENGKEGNRLANEMLPDLIISDVMMPEMDGYQLCEKLKTDELTSHIPVILLTAKADRQSKLAGLETGADDYLAKPFDAEELQLIIRNRIEERRKLRERFSRDITLEPRSISITSLDEQFLKKIMNTIEENMADESFTIEDLSREGGFSRVQFYRKIKALTDQSPSQFLRIIRLKRAAALLQQKSDKVAQIAYSVGFSSLPYFNKCFKEQFGVTPKQYAAADQEIE